MEKINWFPGHMYKTFKDLKVIAKHIDLSIIVLDARAPKATMNDMFDSIFVNSKTLYIFNKIDLCDKNVLTYFINKNKSIFLNYLKTSLKRPKYKIVILKKIQEILKIKENRTSSSFDIKKIIVLGMPNTGKSTLINYLSNKSKLKTANIPGVTKKIQWIQITKQLYLLDTPGLMVPNLKNQDLAYKLAIIGCIKHTILDIKNLIINSYIIFSKDYPSKIKELDLLPCYDIELVEQEILKLAKNKNIEFHNSKRIYFYLFNYFKNLSNITLI